MRFRDRTDAGRQLAQRLAEKYSGQAGVVYALPRGGVVLGAEIAQRLGLPLDLIIARKVGHPYNPEYAVAAVTEAGDPVVNPAEIARIDPQWFAREVDAERREAHRRHLVYTGARPRAAATGKLAILVDDGIATGLTMEAAIHAARADQPARLVVAIPVAPHDIAEKLRRQADDVVALDIPEIYLGAVGAYYEHFPQTSDREVVELLSAHVIETRNN